MELAGTVTIGAARAAVWAALNDPEVLARCIEGVETLTRIEGAGPGDPPRFEGKMHAKVGPVRATFAGQVALTQLVPPESYILVGEGKGGVAGFAKGEAAVVLAEVGGGSTQLSYTVTSSVGGKLAQLGARLIEGTAKGYAESFFARLKAELEAPAVDAAENPAMLAEDAEVIAAPEAPGAAAAPGYGTTAGPGLPPWLWGGAVVLLVLLFLLWRLL